MTQAEMRQKFKKQKLEQQKQSTPSRLAMIKTATFSKKSLWVFIAFMILSAFYWIVKQ